MRLFFYFMLLLALSVGLGLLVAYDPGYMLINYGVWTIEAPLWLAVSAVIFLIVLFVSFFSLLSSAQGLWHGVMMFRSRHAKNRARANTEKGFLALAQGCWRQAEQKLIQGVYDQNRGLLNYLGAAIAAQEQGNEERRDDYLRMAYNANESAELAVGLTQAKLQFEEGQYEQCLATLERLHRLSPNNDYTMKLLQQVYEKLRDWERLLEHLQVMKRRKLLTKDEFERLTRKTYLQQLKKLQAKSASAIAWQKIFHSLPKALQREEAFLLLYLPTCMENAPKEALQLIKDSLKQVWSDDLVAFIGHMALNDVRDQLAYCEGLLKKRPNNAMLRLTLGRLCLKSELWGKAEQHLEAAVANVHSPEACYELAKLHKKLGDQEQAAHYFQLGLSLAIGANLVELDDIKTESE